jgi:hypothetical protein
MPLASENMWKLPEFFFAACLNDNHGFVIYNVKKQIWKLCVRVFTLNIQICSFKRLSEAALTNTEELNVKTEKNK